MNVKKKTELQINMLYLSMSKKWFSIIVPGVIWGGGGRGIRVWTVKIELSGHNSTGQGIRTEAEFLDVFGTKVFRVFLLSIHSHLY